MQSIGKKNGNKIWLFLWLSSLWLAACTAATPQESPPPTTEPQITQAASAPARVGETPMPTSPVTSTSEATAGLSQVTPTTPPPVTQAAPTEPVVQSAASLPAPGSAVWGVYVEGLNRPIGIANAGDGSNRLFVIEQRGRIRIIQDGAVLDAPFLDIRDRIGLNSSEQGLLGLAFHPRFEDNGYFFVNYTDLNGDTVIARFSAVPGDSNQADPGSELRLLFISQPYPNHNGGSVVFGPDGFLYLGLGDGGSANDPQGNGQATDTWLGKILRIDVDAGNPYAIPADNPFSAGGGLSEIWAYGLRNPWRFSFDRQTGDLFVADVGQNQWEEINYLAAGSPGGANFGWNYREGAHEFRGNPPPGLELIDPVAEYSHNQGCSVTGGLVYRGSGLPGWRGVYLYGDYCSGLVWGLLRLADGSWQNSLLYETGAQITSFGEDEAGEMYLSDHSGRILRLSHNP